MAEYAVLAQAHWMTVRPFHASQTSPFARWPHGHRAFLRFGDLSAGVMYPAQPSRGDNRWAPLRQLKIQRLVPDYAAAGGSAFKATGPTARPTASAPSQADPFIFHPSLGATDYAF